MYISRDELKEFLEKHIIYAKENQKKDRCDDQADAYWQGEIDFILLVAEEYDMLNEGKLHEN